MTMVDQQKIRRSRTGLMAHDPALAQPGYTLFAPMHGEGTVYLIDMAGGVAHSWKMPHRPGLYGHLLGNGHMLYGGKIMDDLHRFEAWVRFKAGAVLEVDWNGRIVWEVRHSFCACVRCPRISRAASRADCPALRPRVRMGAGSSTPTTSLK